jgi:hypothetical protein
VDTVCDVYNGFEVLETKTKSNRLTDWIVATAGFTLVEYEIAHEVVVKELGAVSMKSEGTFLILIDKPQ